VTSTDRSDVRPGAPDTGRKAAILLLLLVTLVGLGLRVCGFRVGLPRVFYTDYHQLEEAVSLLTTGSFQDNGTYPTTLVYTYAAGGAALYGLGRLAVPPAWRDWDAFTERLADPSFRHAFGRIWSALVDALAIPGTYLLARACFGRRVALVAAALVACSPINVMISHQVRIHVPTSTLAVFAAIPFARQMTATPGTRAMLGAGAAAGFVASCFQLGYLLLLAELLTLAVLARPWRRALALAGAFLGGAVAAVAFGMVLARLPGVVVPGSGSAVIGAAVGSGRFVFGVDDLFRDLARVPRQYGMWVMSLPVSAAAVAAYLVLAARDRGLARTALLYGAYPLLGVTALALVQGDRARFTLPLAVFTAPLAAAACLSVPRALPRRGLLALLIGVPLLTCLRYDALLVRPDTRDVLEAVLPRVAAPERPVLVDARLLITERPLPAGASAFPRGQDYRPWHRGETSPRRELRESRAAVYVRPRDLPAPAGLNPDELSLLGFERYGELQSAPVAMMPRAGMASLPDMPSAPVVDVWTTWRLGPSIEVWVRGEDARAALAQVAAPEALPTLRMP
jgi:hypothetical protein